MARAHGDARALSTDRAGFVWDPRLASHVYREDHPLRDDDHWLKHSLAYRQDDGTVRLDYKDVKLGPYIPMERKY